ncbi:hypothetical protein PSI23_15015 [Xenorhabdus sp. XENO-10]|uniref:Uncharacterized protein n=1 Tax=Xenorhabdus yunnanensis TaxID=3025878 RepID=A0ABT5LHH2_9GAMM|nr:hypothetical protein [Xenorhabdus yunnanensis]MDC9590561.1 hypothetical protein [Xenorhabdus yunnanensis]
MSLVWLRNALPTIQIKGVITRLMLDSLAGFTSILPRLDTGEALMLGDAVLLPSRIRLDKPVITPDSATRDFWKEWGTNQLMLKLLIWQWKH